MSSITPAILAGSYREFKTMINSLAPTVTKLHIDVCDGAFTRKPSWPYIKHDDHFEAMVATSEGLPHWQEVDYDVHIMCKDPAKFAEQWMQAGAQRAFVHIETFEDETTATDVFNLQSDFFEIGLAARIDTDMSRIMECIESYQPKALLCMSIVNIGAYGQPFDERVIDRLRVLREKYPDLQLLVDGGIKEEHIESLATIPTNEIIVGSAIVAEPEPLTAFYNLQGLAEV